MNEGILECQDGNGRPSWHATHTILLHQATSQLHDSKFTLNRMVHAHTHPTTSGPIPLIPTESQQVSVSVLLVVSRDMTIFVDSIDAICTMQLMNG